MCASHPREREKHCLNYLAHNFEFALISANAYMKYYTGEQAFYDIEQLTEKIRTSILNRIENSVQNATTRVGLTEYIKRIKVRPRSDQIACNFTDVLAENLDIKWNAFKPHSYYILALQEFQHNKFMVEVEPRMYASALSVNAYYSPDEQQVRFLSFLINSLYSDQHHTPSLYGGIGSVLAHEFGHSLDPRIIPGYYMSSLMDPQTNATLNTFSDCLVDLYNKAGVSGETSLQDNYSDIFGLTIVVETFKREENRKKIQEALANSPILYHFTPEELMFVTYGQVWCQASVNKRKAHNLGQWSHAPNEARINIVLSAIPEFSETYKCPANSFMTSGQHCKVWP
ncbi:neprilysin-1-like [Convolutriloba macropyga]|uniref:neprilysin-1-like n=1 Tax=Convolutriloba macropyga TaxID=536237 RepID=UPI003F52247C